MKRILSEKSLVLFLFVTALAFFYVANEDAKKAGVLQSTTMEVKTSPLTDAQQPDAGLADNSTPAQQ